MSAASKTVLLLKPTEAASTLGIGRSKLFELLAEGRIESIKLGRCRLIPRDCIDEFIARERGRAEG